MLFDNAGTGRKGEKEGGRGKGVTSKEGGGGGGSRLVCAR